MEAAHSTAPYCIVFPKPWSFLSSEIKFASNHSQNDLTKGSILECDYVTSELKMLLI